MAVPPAGGSEPRRRRLRPDGSWRRGPRPRSASWLRFSRPLLLSFFCSLSSLPATGCLGKPMRLNLVAAPSVAISRLGKPMRPALLELDCLLSSSDDVKDGGCGQDVSKTDTTLQVRTGLLPSLPHQRVARSNTCLISQLIGWGDRVVDICLGSMDAWNTAGSLGSLRCGPAGSKFQGEAVQVLEPLQLQGWTLLRQLRDGPRRVFTLTSCFPALEQRSFVARCSTRCWPSVISVLVFALRWLLKLIQQRGGSSTRSRTEPRAVETCSAFGLRQSGPASRLASILLQRSEPTSRHTLMSWTTALSATKQTVVRTSISETFIGQEILAKTGAY